MNDEWVCPVDDCGFAAPFDDVTRETIEQHVRWVHLRTSDFGSNPMEALVQFSFNGFLRPEEFARLTETIMQREFERLTPPVPLRYLVADCVYGAATVASVVFVYTLQVTGRLGWFYASPLLLLQAASMANWWVTTGRSVARELRRRRVLVVESGNNAETGSEVADGERGGVDRTSGEEPGDAVSP